MQEIVWKLKASIRIWSGRALHFEFVQTPISWTCCGFRSAAGNKIWFWTWGFVLIPYFYPETNDWSKDEPRLPSNELCFGLWQVLAKSNKIPFPHVATSSNCQRFKTALCLCLPVWPVKAVYQNLAPRAWLKMLAVIALDSILERLFWVIARW